MAIKKTVNVIEMSEIVADERAANPIAFDHKAIPLAGFEYVLIYQTLAQLVERVSRLEESFHRETQYVQRDGAGRIERITKMAGPGCSQK